MTTVCTSDSGVLSLERSFRCFFCFLRRPAWQLIINLWLLIQKISSTLFAWGSYQFMHSISLMQLNCAVILHFDRCYYNKRLASKANVKTWEDQIRGLFFLCIWRKGFKVQEPLDHMVSSWGEILPWFYAFVLDHLLTEGKLNLHIHFNFNFCVYPSVNVTYYFMQFMINDSARICIKYFL